MIFGYASCTCGILPTPLFPGKKQAPLACELAMQANASPLLVLSKVLHVCLLPCLSMAVILHMVIRRTSISFKLCIPISDSWYSSYRLVYATCQGSDGLLTSIISRYMEHGQNGATTIQLRNG